MPVLVSVRRCAACGLAAIVLTVLAASLLGISSQPGLARSQSPPASSPTSAMKPRSLRGHKLQPDHRLR
jgi:hypothetical protein